MFVGAGTVINVLAILSATVVGVFFGKYLKPNLKELLTQSLGLIVLIAAADAISEFWREDFQSYFNKGAPILILLVSLILGAITGTTFRIEERLEGMGERLRSRFSRNESPRFVEGFMAASVLFVVGPMAILGGISDGMGTGIELLLLKSTLDFFMAIAFTTSYGWGVGLSAIPVGLYQISWTAIGAFLGAILNQAQVVSITVIGGLLLIGIALRSLGIKKIAIGNLLPAIFNAPILVAIFSN